MPLFRPNPFIPLLSTLLLPFVVASSALAADGKLPPVGSTVDGTTPIWYTP